MDARRTQDHDICPAGLWPVELIRPETFQFLQLDVSSPAVWQSEISNLMPSSQVA
ncbi:hypothetical protein DPMN_119925 [Dreissena polymorpha]|uniref:Uncharacterized protein n=1 Tax=Dreissena polymorpha TaxID=45954 RepID=A0A9D4GMW5_DREPO|nr:hypothetical protein DPMN_119925 [Dreissena polymorpha]